MPISSLAPLLVLVLTAFGQPSLPARQGSAAAQTTPPAAEEPSSQAASPLTSQAGTPEAPALESASTGIKLLPVKEGYFLMGVSARAEWLQAALPRKSEIEHLVHLSHPFYLGQFEVTQKAYETVMGQNPSWFNAKNQGKAKVANKETDQFPVEAVTWFDAIEFCNRLSVKDGLPPYYKISSSTNEVPLLRLKGVSIAGGKGYRLPTEAEWERACRAGGATKYFFGNEFELPRANCLPVRVASGYGVAPHAAPLGRTEKVGSFAPNKWGFADMSGNVAEWCWDWYDETYYDKSKLSDPAGPEFGGHRVLRGGSWVQNPELARSTARYGNAPAQTGYFIGFRIARNP